MAQNDLTILVVDDTPANIDLLVDVLVSTGCRLKVATTGERAVELALREPPDLILMDVMMPGIDGFEACRQLKADPATAEVPVIFVTARHEDVSRGFQVGGADYITKPIQADEVRARVNHQLERRQLLATLRQLNAELEDKVRDRTAELVTANHQLRQEVQERRYMQDRLNYLATHDFVTRLHNRSALDAHVSELLARRQRERLEAVFLMLDLDQFRLVNESCGCIAGDELLRMVADSVSGVLGRRDFFARLGGDKFAVVAEVAPGEEAQLQLARAIQRQINSFEFHWESRVFRFAVTIAVVPFSDEIVAFDQLMLMADETAFLAKRDGRGLLRLYQSHGAGVQDHRETVNWALVLVDALRHGRLRVHFQRLQPLDASQGPQRLHVELLMRLWDETHQQLVYPSRFIPPAERFHLIADLDRWMLREAIGFLGQHAALHELLGRVTVNLSALSLRDADLAGFVLGLLDQHQVPPGLLCFEITETEALINLEVAQAFMRQMAERGCHFAVDDFGSGYASYRYLRELPFDLLKIDGLFVHDMDRDAGHAAMVGSIVDMARLLGKPLVAECVEHEGLLPPLLALGVPWAQGFHFHRPEPLTAEALLVQADRAKIALLELGAQDVLDDEAAGV